MKRVLKLYLIYALLIAALLSLSACTLPPSDGGGDTACTKHTDSDGDELCDKCFAYCPAPEDDSIIKLISKGKVGFKVIVNFTENPKARNVFTKLARMLEDEYSMKLLVVNDEKENKELECEILVGNVTSRGEKYCYDYHALGPDGRAVEVIDNKIIIAGGSEEALYIAASEFVEKYFPKENSGTLPETLSFPKADVYRIQHDPEKYAWDECKIAGRDISEFSVYADFTRTVTVHPVLKNRAQSLIELVYNNIGIYMPLYDYSKVQPKAGESAIVFAITDEVLDDGGFKITADENGLYVLCSYTENFLLAYDLFYEEYMENADTGFSFDDGFCYTYELRYFTYEQFGAVGDGAADDYEAMKAAHDAANKCGRPVIGRAGASYNVGAHAAPIKIKTDTDWTDVTIIIDDSELLPVGGVFYSSVFSVESSNIEVVHDSYSELMKAVVAAGGISRETEKIPYDFGHDAMLIVNDDSHKVYIRYGGNANGGSAQSELVIVDKDGNIDGSTPFLLDYSNISSIIEYRIDDTPITIKGGTLITVANQAPSAYTYFNRNISVNRSNVTIDGLVHKIVGEIGHGAPYGGFISASKCNNVRVVNSVFTAHRAYYNLDSSTGGKTLMGTYEISASFANNYYFQNCTQTNFYTPAGGVNYSNRWYDGNGNTQKNSDGKTAGIWGVMGTNSCKNITYDSCKLNRFDAHQGMVNATIKDSEVITVNLIGGGTALIENTRIYNSSAVTLRDDYGSTWRGDIILDGLDLVTGSSSPVLVSGYWRNHDFGYETYLPNLTVKSLKITGKATRVYAFSAYSLNSDTTAPTVGGKVNKNICHIPKEIVIYPDSIAVDVGVSLGSYLNSAITIVEIRP